MCKAALALACFLHVGNGRQDYVSPSVADDLDHARESLAMLLLLPTVVSRNTPRTTRSRQVTLKEPGHRENGLPRRSLLNGAGSMATAAVLAPHAALSDSLDVRGVNGLLPTSLDGINAYLKSKGFAPFDDLPFEYRPLMLLIGSRPPANIDGQKILRRNFKGTLLVRFPHPRTWVVQAPKIDANAESGNIVAVDNFSAETAAFFSEPLPSGVTSLESVSNEVLAKALTNEAKDGIGDVKIKSKKIVKTPDGETLLTFKTSWSIFSRVGAEFRVEGYASCFIKADAIVGISVYYQANKASKSRDKAVFIAENSRIYEVPTPTEFEGGDLNY